VQLPGLTFWTQITFIYHIGIAARAQFKAINRLRNLIEPSSSLVIPKVN
jgi:hypothetical protein